MPDTHHFVSHKEQALPDTSRVERLIAQLSDSSPMFRQSAVHALIRTRDRRAVSPLAAELSDRDRKTRLEAINALFSLAQFVPEGTGAIVPLLMQTVDPDSDVRFYARQAAEYISHLNGYWLANHFEDSNPIVRANAVIALGMLGDTGVRARVLPLLANANADIRAHAAFALYVMGDTTTLKPLMRLIGDPVAQVRRSALRSILRLRGWYFGGPDLAVPGIGDPSEVPRDSLLAPFVVKALSDHDSVVGAMAANSVLSLTGLTDPDTRRPLMRDPRAVRYVIASLAEDSSEGMLGSMWLARMGAQAISQLKAALRSKNAWVRRGAAKALDRTDSRSPIEPPHDIAVVFNAALKTGDLAVVGGAYRAFVAMGKDGSESLLVRALGRYGTGDMARCLYYSGNDTLQKAVDVWTRSHGGRGLREVQNSRDYGPIWGGMRP